MTDNKWFSTILLLNILVVYLFFFAFRRILGEQILLQRIFSFFSTSIAYKHQENNYKCNVILVLRMQYNYWGCRKQKLWFWCLTVSQLVPTSIENVPGWITMSHNVILVLRMQYYFWGCSTISEDVEGKNFDFDVSQCPNKYIKCPRMIYNVS